MRFIAVSVIQFQNPRTEALNIVIDQIEGMEENIQNVSDRRSLKVSMHELEVQRINFVVKDYVRLRLKKVCWYRSEF